MDLVWLLLDLIGEEYFSPEYYKKIMDLKWGVSTCVVRLGLKKKVTDIQMITQVGQDNAKQYIDDLMAGKMPEIPYMFMVSPSNMSDKIAPEGKQLINICTGLPVEAPDEVIDRMDELMIRGMEQYVPGLRENIEWKEFSTRKQLETLFGEEGAGIGIGSTPFQTGKFRPSTECEIENIFFISGEAGGRGCATEMIMTGAIECVDKNF